MMYSIALGLLLALAAFGTAAFIADRLYSSTFLAEPPEGRRHIGH
jgi:hypothetical protein